MSSLKIVMIDVAWGDSIFLEAKDSHGVSHYALIDSNDTSNYKASLIYLRKFFQRLNNTSSINKPVFDWVMLSHAHLDHGQGLKEIMRTFGTRNFYYPKSIENRSLAHLQEYANRAGISHQAIDDDRAFPDFGDTAVKVLWPQANGAISDNENDNSIVLSLKQGNHVCMLTGDAEEDVWNVIKNKIPAETVFFKVPHHGSRNGSLDHARNGTWITDCPTGALLAMSTHNRPYEHPHQEVLDLFDNNGFSYLRTDEHYHIEITIDNNGLSTKFSH